MVFPPSVVPTANGRGTKFREPTGHDITPGIPPELSNLMHQVLATERIGPLRRGDFVLCTTNLRSWIAADAKHLHHTIFLKTANSVCRGAGDSHLPRSMRARSPHGLFSRRRGDFVLCTTNLRSWIAADAKHLHHTIFVF